VRGGAQSLRLSAIFIMGCKEPETSPNFGERRAQNVPRDRDCRRFDDGGAKSLRRPPISVRGVLRACDCQQFSSWGCKKPETSRNFRAEGRSEPETVGNFHHGGAQSLRRPPILASGVHKKCPEPETVCDFTMGVQRA